MRSTCLPPMSYNTDLMSVDEYHANWLQQFSLWGPLLLGASAAPVDSKPISSWRDHFTLFGSTCNLDLSNLSQSEPCLDAGLFSPESSSGTTAQAPVQPSTRILSWV